MLVFDENHKIRMALKYYNRFNVHYFPFILIAGLTIDL